MKKINFIIAIFSISFILIFSGFANSTDNNSKQIQLADNTPYGIKQAKIKRGNKLVNINDDKISKTIKDYGGVYTVNGNQKELYMNNKTYKDFYLEIIKGETLVIHTKDGKLSLKMKK